VPHPLRFSRVRLLTFLDLPRSGCLSYFPFPSFTFLSFPPNSFPFSCLIIYLDMDGTLMVTSYLIASHHARRFVPPCVTLLFTLSAEGPHCLLGPLSSNSFICHRSKILHISEHPERMRVPSDHRESRDLTRALSPLAATLAENHLLSPAFATDPRSHSRKSFACHTSKTPPRGVLCVAQPLHFFRRSS